VSGQAEQADGEVAQAGHHSGAAAGADAGGVFANGHVADPVEFVLHVPVPADVAGQLGGLGLRGGQGGHRVDGLAGRAWGAVIAFAGPDDLDGMGGVREDDPGGDGDDLVGAGHRAAVAGVGLAVSDWHVFPWQTCQLIP
jgi:hypothetical protein